MKLRICRLHYSPKQIKIPAYSKTKNVDDRMQYNLDYHIQMDKSHILPNILKGAQTGISSQFISDVIISLLLFNEELVIEDIQVSAVSAYYASVASGMVAGLLSIYVDPIALVAFTVITYGIVFEIVDYLTTDNPIIFTPQEDIFDICLTILLVVLFDPVARHQYERFKQKRQLIEPTLQREDRTLVSTIFFSVLLSTYNFLKLSSRQNETELANTNSVGP